MGLRLFTGLVCGILLLSECKKVDIEINETEINTSQDGSIRFIEHVNNKFIIGGGDRSSSGFIAEYIPTTESIQSISDSFPLPVYSCTYFFGRYVFVNEAGTIFYTRNEKLFFEHLLNEKDFIPSLHQQPSHQLLLNNSADKVFNIAGGEYQYGLIQQCSDTFNTWQPLIFDNELRAAVFTNTNEAWAGGFGILLHSVDDGMTWSRLNFDPVYITDIEFFDSKNGVLSTFEGKFYFTNDGGGKWKESDSEGRKGYINAMESLSSSFIIAVGEDGTICTSNDRGKNWKCDKRLKGNDLTCARQLSGFEALIGGEEGKLWRVKF